MRYPRQIFSFALILFMTSMAYAGDSPKKGKDLLSQPAGKAFLFGNYQESLDLLSKKGSLSADEQFLKARALYHLNQYEDAKKALTALPEKNQKTPYVQYWLAHTLYGLQDKSGAEQIWQGLSKKDSAFGLLSAAHLNDLSKQKTIASLGGKKSELSEELFLKTPGAQYFKDKKYETSLSEFKQLAGRYPDDPTVQRYLGMTHLKLNQPDKAIEIYQNALNKNPLNAALHIELAKAYEKKKEKDFAKREYEFVRDFDDSGLYSIPAEKALKGKSKKKKKKSFLPEKLKVRGATGWEYASNVAGTSEVPERRKPGDRNGGKYRYNLGAIYELWKHNQWEFNLDAALDHSFFDDGFDEKNTFLHTLGLAIGYDTKMFGKPLKFVLRQGETHATKKLGWFSFANITSFDIKYEPSKRYELDLYERWGYTKFRTNGNRKDTTGKDGITQKFGLKQKYTPTKNKDFFFSLDIGYGYARPIGRNGRFHAFELKPGIGFPLLWEVKGEFTVGYKRDYFPEFNFPATRRIRRGHGMAMDLVLERDITKDLALLATYGYDNVDNLNASYRKTNHTFGTGLKFKL